MAQRGQRQFLFFWQTGRFNRIHAVNQRIGLSQDQKTGGGAMKGALTIVLVGLSSVVWLGQAPAQAQSTKVWACYAQNTWNRVTGDAGGWAPQATREKAAAAALVPCNASSHRRGNGPCRIMGCDTFDTVAEANASQCKLFRKYRIVGGGRAADDNPCR